MAKQWGLLFRRCVAIRRIKRMERHYDSLLAAPNSHAQLILSRYYSSGRWLRDYELDEQGLLPRDLKRGVLSQDGLWNLLQERGPV